MKYKPVKCELTLLTRSIIPAMKAVFTNKRVFLFWILFSLPYYLLLHFISFSAGVSYIIIMCIFMIWIIHNECVTMDA